MESPSSSHGILPKGPSRKPMKRMNSTVSQDTSTETVLISPAKIINVDIKNNSSNETDDESTGIEGEVEERDKEDLDNEVHGNDHCIGLKDGDEIRHVRRSTDREVDSQKDTKPVNKASITEETKQPLKYPYTTIVVVLAVLVLIIGLWLRCNIPKKETTVRHTCENFLQLHSKYPNADDMLWSTLIVGVERAVNDPGEPATFIFLYNSSSASQSLLNDVIHITTECFGNRGAIWRTSNDFKSAEIMQDYAVVLDQHRADLKSQGVLVVRDLDQIPPNAAQVFFTICDAYEPLVRKAAIFFTIDISQRIYQSQRSPTAIAEGILKDLWRKELHSNVLDPLVVRLTENVFKID